MDKEDFFLRKVKEGGLWSNKISASEINFFKKNALGQESQEDINAILEHLKDIFGEENFTNIMSATINNESVKETINQQIINLSKEEFKEKQSRQSILKSIEDIPRFEQNIEKINNDLLKEETELERLKNIDTAGMLPGLKEDLSAKIAAKNEAIFKINLIRQHYKKELDNAIMYAENYESDEERESYENEQKEKKERLEIKKQMRQN